MFTKEERSGFKYWFAHWRTFQMTALNLNAENLNICCTILRNRG